MYAPSPPPRRAFMFLIIIAVNVGVHLFQFAKGESGMDGMIAMIHWGANVAPLTLTGEPARLLTSMFLHAGLLHLFLNMYMLLAVGRVAETAFGSLRFALIYLMSGLFGGLLSALWYARRTVAHVVIVRGEVVKREQLELVLSVGASGALMGIAGACLAHWFVVDRKGQSAEALSMRGPLLQTIGLTLLMGFLLPGVDNAAHIGGVLSGAILGALFALASVVRHAVGGALAGLAICGAAAIVLAIGVRPEPSAALLQLRGELIDELAAQSRQ